MNPSKPLADPRAIRVVLFGPSNSGKTSLRDALVSVIGRDAEEKPVDLTPEIEASEDRGRVVGRKLQVDRIGSRERTGTVLFIDCDSNQSNELLLHPDRLKRSKARSEVADAIRGADALVVIFDASWKPDQLFAYFASLQSFFDELKLCRIEDRDVGGLPIFLTLTKCDALNASTTGPDEWMRHIVRRKNEIKSGFAESFTDKFGFGTADVYVAATATRMPAGSGYSQYGDGAGRLMVVDPAEADDQSEKNEVPFGIALIEKAEEHRDRRLRSNRRLTWISSLAVGLISLAIVTLFALGLAQEPGEVQRLMARVERLQQFEGPTAVRLSEERLPGYRRELAAIRRAPGYDGLPTATKAYLAERLEEADAYAAYAAKFEPPQFSPAEVRTYRDLARLASEIDGVLAPPAGYAAAWSDTELSQLRQKWRDDLQLLRRTEEQVHAWSRGRITRANELMLANVPGTVAPAEWRKQLGELLDAPPPFDANAPVAGSRRLDIRRGEPLTMAAALRFERSAMAERDASLTSTKLLRLRELADEAGLATPPGQIASFDIPAAPLDPLGFAATRVERADRIFDGPDANPWTLATIPGPLQDELGRRLRLSRSNGIEAVRKLILAEQKSVGWAALSDPARDGLLTKPALKDWGRLLHRLDRLIDGEQAGPNPVDDLAAFVAKDSFSWPIASFEIVLPNSLRVKSLKPDGNLIIRAGSGDAVRTYEFSPGDAVQNEAESLTHKFVRTADKPLEVKLDEAFEASLALTDGETKYRLRWSDGRNATYQFDRLLRTPTIAAEGPNAVTQPATGVRLKATPATADFRVPILLPETR